jgi:hypothetical protein
MGGKELRHPYFRGKKSPGPTEKCQFWYFLNSSSCSFAFFRLAYPLSKERFINYLSCELKEEFKIFYDNQIVITVVSILLLETGRKISASLGYVTVR